MALSVPDVERELGYVYDAIRLLRRELDGRVPLIGFAGTPWTVASYVIEGGTSKSFAHLLGWSHRDPQGLARLLDLLADAGFRLALASSSPPVLIDAVLGKLGLGKRFEAIHSAIHEERGKPDPAVYLTTCRELGVDPGRCLAFEDSPAGVRSAKAAGLTVVAVPHEDVRNHPVYDLADQVLDSLLDFRLADFRGIPVASDP